jgi:hypothetical protein
MNIEKLPREDLIKLVEVYAKNWLAHNGCWFLAIAKVYRRFRASRWDRWSIRSSRAQLILASKQRAFTPHLIQ